MRKLILLAVLGLLLAFGARAEVKVEKVEYKGWRNCYRVSNGEVELIATSDVGPRVIRFGFVGGQTFSRNLRSSLGRAAKTSFNCGAGTGYGRHLKILWRHGRRITCRWRFR